MGVEPALAQCVEPDAPPKNDCATAIQMSLQNVSTLGGKPPPETMEC